MKASDYPGNGEIDILRQAIIDLDKVGDWQSAFHASVDLKHEIQKRDKWIKENVDY